MVSLLISACGSAASEPVAESTVAPSEVPTQAPTETDLPTQEPTDAPTLAPFTLRIEGFTSGELIPDRFACRGENLSPQISWNEPPAGTQSFVLIFDDPDATGGTWVHWILFDVPADIRELAEGLAPESYPAGSLSGLNSWGRLPYGGPCPPEGTTHQYLFMLYALDTALGLEEGASKAELIAAMEGHVLAESLYTGFYSR